MMRRFWISFSCPEGTLPIGFESGCGVTAPSLERAVEIVAASAFGGTSPPIDDVIEDVELGRLDRNHVLPNTGDPNVEGIWFPQGYPMRRCERATDAR